MLQINIVGFLMIVNKQQTKKCFGEIESSFGECCLSEKIKKVIEITYLHIFYGE